MANLEKDITALKDPANIKKALLASSPYVLRKIFAAEPIIQRLIRAGEKVVPLIAEQTRGARKLDEITLAAYAYILEKVKADAAPEVLGAQFRKAVEKPGPFFVHFAAHAMRSALRMPLKPLEMVYSPEELMETQNRIR